MLNCLYVTGSVLLFLAVIGVGISFFGPFWLQNLKPTEPALTNETYIVCSAENSCVTWMGNYSRGLWAQCGSRCQWFWESNYILQRTVFTPLRWHIATQVLYAFGGGVLLLAEILSRFHTCCAKRNCAYVAVTVYLGISFVSQLAAIIVFGVSAAARYGALSKPLQNFAWEFTSDVYFGWNYWMAVAGVGLTLLSFLSFAALSHRYRLKYLKE